MMYMKFLAQLPFFFAIGVIFLTGCGDTTMKNMSYAFQTDAFNENDWESLSAKRIFFGHQSVGYNIIDGMRDLMKINPGIKCTIEETADLAGLRGGVFAHARNGENGNPKSKINSFASAIRSGVGKHADIAFFKFCYVDFNENTDVKDVFNHYKKTMGEIRKEYPSVRFLNATVPITTEGELLDIRNRVKDMIKKIIGRTTMTEKNALSNIKRNEFNGYLLAEYGKGTTLDIAAYESIDAKGKQYKSRVSGSEHLTMAPSNTSDGGHLNEPGRMVVADRFLAQLLKALQQETGNRP
ncbi:MAG: hypothetical protein QUS13_12260 [Smithella sp.]|nr:hypothetical protein [Smithella sp.]